MFNLDNLRPQDQRPLILSNGNNGAIIRIDSDGNCLFKAVVEGYKHLGRPIPDYITDHAVLRTKVAQELRKPEYLQVINSTLSDEKGVSIEAITDIDRENYFNKMAKPNIWGGTPELYVIAKILQIRIIIHQAGSIIKIPQDTEYDTWPELIELVHEPVNAGLSSLLPTDKKSDNHYNLAMPEVSARKIINDYHNEKILAFKAGMQKCPHLDSEDKEFKNFKDFFISFHHFYKTVEAENPDTKLRDKSFYHLEMLWGYLLHEFMSPMWSYDDNGYNEEVTKKYWLSGRVDTKRLKALIREAIQRGELKRFFEAYPYVKDLIIIDEYLSEQSPSVALKEKFYKTMNNYLAILQHYDQVQPLLVLREHVKLMLDRSDFDMEFYKKYMKGAQANLGDRKFKPASDLIFLSLFIGTNISYDLRMSAGFRKLNWDAFEGLYRRLYKDRNVVDAARLRTVAEGLERYLDDLILFQLGQISEEAIKIIVDVGDIAIINVTENVAPAFQIIENYLGILDQITEDNEISRLATLRTITAIGEAIHSISLLLPEDHRKSLKVITDIRDHVIHSSTLDAFNYINVLIRNLDNKMLNHCLVELRDLKGFFANLKGWLESDKQPTNLPQIPPLRNLTLLEQEFAKARSKDDRDEQISIALSSALLASLPADDGVLNPDLEHVQGFIFSEVKLSIDEFKNACPTLSASVAKKRHEQIVEWKKITGLRKALAEHSIDFNKVNLNVAKEHKDRLKKIKEQKDVKNLEAFLNEHEETVGLSQEFLTNFINSIRIIDIKPYKLLLKKFVEKGIGEIQKEEFVKAIKVIFRDNPDHQKLWEMSYEMLTRRHINSFKRYQIVQLDHALQNIERFGREISSIFDGKYVDAQKNLVVSIACEMLYGFCLDGFKRIKKFLKDMYDYKDQTLYFLIPNHPLEKVEDLLKVAILMRNDIFHFERVYRSYFHIEGLRMIWFSYIQDLTHGTFSPETIVFSKTGVTREAIIMSNPTSQELQKLRDIIAKDLPRDENSLNMYEAEVKDIVCRARIASDTNRVMKIIIPFSQMIRQNAHLKDDPKRSNIFLSIFRHLDVQYIEPTTFLSLLDAATKQKVVTAQEVRSLVYSSQQTIQQRLENNVEKTHASTYSPAHFQLSSSSSSSSSKSATMPTLLQQLLEKTTVTLESSGNVLVSFQNTKDAQEFQLELQKAGFYDSSLSYAAQYKEIKSQVTGRGSMEEEKEEYIITLTENEYEAIAGEDAYEKLKIDENIPVLSSSKMPN